MKRTVVGLLLASAMFPGMVSAQAPAEQTQRRTWSEERMTIHVREGWAPEILAVIVKATGVTLQFDNDLKAMLEQRVTIDVIDGRAGDILPAVLRAANLTFKVIDDKTIQIMKR